MLNMHNKRATSFVRAKIQKNNYIFTRKKS